MAYQVSVSNLITKLIKKQTEAQIARKPLECFELTADEWEEIASSVYYMQDFGPRPPIKAQASFYGGGGLFSSGISGSYVEYDYHAPEYLEARKNWKPSGPKLFGVPLKLIQ